MPKHPNRGRAAANQRDPAEIPVSQGHCGVCGRVTLDGVTPCILVTVRHADGSWLSACYKCYRWWHIKDGTRAPRILEATHGDEESSLSQDGKDGVGQPSQQAKGTRVALHKMRGGSLNERVSLDDGGICEDPPGQSQAAESIGGFLVTNTPTGKPKRRATRRRTFRPRGSRSRVPGVGESAA